MSEVPQPDVDNHQIRKFRAFRNHYVLHINVCVNYSFVIHVVNSTQYSVKDIWYFFLVQVLYILQMLLQIIACKIFINQVAQVLILVHL